MLNVPIVGGACWLHSVFCTWRHLFHKTGKSREGGSWPSWPDPAGSKGTGAGRVPSVKTAMPSRNLRSCSAGAGPVGRLVPSSGAGRDGTKGDRDPPGLLCPLISRAQHTGPQRWSQHRDTQTRKLRLGRLGTVPGHPWDRQCHSPEPPLSTPVGPSWPIRRVSRTLQSQGPY